MTVWINSNVKRNSGEPNRYTKQIAKVILFVSEDLRLTQSQSSDVIHGCKDV